MKKFLCALAAAVMCAAVLCACGKPAKEPAPSEITAAIMAELEIPSAVEKTAENAGDYYDVDLSRTEALSVYICGSGAYPDELAVFKMSSEEDVAAAKEAVQKRLDNQIELYRDYTPKEFYKLEEAKVTVKEKYVMLFVCSDDTRADTIANALFN